MNRLWKSTLALAALIATPATAQDDWDLGRDPERKLTIAAVTYDNFGVAVRCMDDVMSVVVSGLPTGPGIRTIRHQLGDQVEMNGRWVSAGDGAAAFSIWPASTAAYLARGGRWVLDVPDGVRVRRISADIPASPAAIGEVFSACGRTLSPASLLEEPNREDFGGLSWVRVPVPTFPTRTDALGGLAAITCTATARGDLRGCRVESEFPEGAGFGRSATMAAHRDGKVRPSEPGPMSEMEGRRASWVVRYNMSDEVPLPAIATRLPDRFEREAQRPVDAD
ncbi:MAG: hypothetical protein M3Q74_08210 [Pseudomonadota bacterium]|nr:hypothetical protein [Pseudomonadota bacterium]